MPLYFATILLRNQKQIVAAPDYIGIAQYKPLFTFYKADCFMFEIYFMLEKVRAGWSVRRSQA